MRSVVLLLGVTLAILLTYVGAASAVDDLGYRDFSFSANSVDNPTGEKPQSKLWFNDGTWWASMFNRTAEEYHIYRYDRATHTWGDTGTLIDERNNSKADTLWDGSHLYVATAGACTSCSPQSARILRYSYDAVTKRYSLDPGFPITGISNGGMQAIVLDKDTTGKLWVTYTQNRKVYVNRSLSTDQTWGTPFVLPVNGTSVSPDDISAVVAFDSQIGVMWSNQRDSAMYFATHTDGDADDVWQSSRTAIQGPNFADDHISLRSLQVDDVSGRVFAAVKTSLNDLPNPNPNAPLIFLLARGQDGNWTNHVFGRVGDNHTRPIVMIDEEHRDLYMFATAPCCTGGAIYYKKSSLSNVSFSDGVGTPFIQSPTDTNINDATSTKQNVSSATGLMVMASSGTVVSGSTGSGYYWHNIMDLGSADTVAPTVSGVAPADGTTDAAVTANVEATFSEAMDPTTISGSTFTLAKQGSSQSVTATVTYDAATKKATLDPDADLDPSATYTAAVKGGTSGVKDPAGNPLAQDKTWSFTTAAAPPPADTTPPETTIDSGPSGTLSSSSASFTFSSDEAGSTFECKLEDAGTFAPCTSPKAYDELSNGSHTFEVRATDAAGNSDATSASRTWTVDTTAPVVCTITGTANAEIISGTSGNDVICGGGGGDTIMGGGGNDILRGEGGADKLYGEGGDDTFDGGLGIDTANFSSSLAPITASLTSNTATGEGQDTLTAIENLEGSSKNDTLTGSEGNNNIYGGALGDSLTGMGGADTLSGAGGPDSINSQDGVNGNDSLNGGAGTDTKTTDTTEKSIVGFP
jgi:Ca2+-binding RTX toxin-like protein